MGRRFFCFFPAKERENGRCLPLTLTRKEASLSKRRASGREDGKGAVSFGVGGEMINFANEPHRAVALGCCLGGTL